MLNLTDPGFEVGLEDYREVAPGCWFPWREVSRAFSLDEQGRTALDSTQTMTVTGVEVDRPLADDLFAVAIPDGARVVDQAAYSPLNCVQQADRTAAEWAEIVAQARTQAGRDRKYAEAQARLIGRPAPEFPPEALWLHGAPARWADLLGQVVVLDFWSEWCLPCRGDLPTLGRVHRDRAAHGLTVIGIHTSGSDPAAIDQVLRDFGLDYPIGIDVAAPASSTAWGAMFAAYGVEPIPHAVLVDRQGRIAATGFLDGVLAKARELARPAP